MSASRKGKGRAAPEQQLSAPASAPPNKRARSAPSEPEAGSSELLELGSAPHALPDASALAAMNPTDLHVYLEYSYAAWQNYAALQAQRATESEAKLAEVEERVQFLSQRNQVLEARNNELEVSGREMSVRFKKLGEIVKLRGDGRTGAEEVLETLEKELTEGTVSLAKLRPRVPVPSAYRLAPKKLILIDLENVFRELGDADPARRAKDLVGEVRPKNAFTKFTRGFNVRTNKIETTKVHDTDATTFLLAARTHFGVYPAEAGEVYLDLERARGHGSKGTPGMEEDGEGEGEDAEE